MYKETLCCYILQNDRYKIEEYYCYKYEHSDSNRFNKINAKKWKNDEQKVKK